MLPAVIVQADDGNVFGHVQPGFLYCFQSANRHHVACGKYRVHSLIQKIFHAVIAAVSAKCAFYHERFVVGQTG